MAINNEPVDDINTIIGTGTKFEGNIEVAQSLRIDGVFKGIIDVSHTLIVGSTGEVSDVTINVKNAIISGKIKGNINASSKVILESSSKFEGDISAKFLIIEEGALFIGNCKCGDLSGQPSRETLPDTDLAPTPWHSKLFGSA